MKMSVSEAKAALTELVRLAEAGDEVVLTRHGHAVARLERIRPKVGATDRRALMNALRASVGVAKAGPSAPRSQDFLYDEDGLAG